MLLSETEGVQRLTASKVEIYFNYHIKSDLNSVLNALRHLRLRHATTRIDCGLDYGVLNALRHLRLRHIKATAESTFTALCPTPYGI